GTVIADFTSQINSSEGCAPELGINFPSVDPESGDTTFGCPVDFDSLVPGVAPTVSVDVPLVGQIIQVKRGARLALATGLTINTTADTAISGREGGCLQAGSTDQCSLRDTGVPFVYVDGTARNNLRYFYSVVSFDINSFQSGPSSIESSRVTKPVTPVALASNYTSEAVVTSELTGRGTVLQSGPLPTLDPATSTFSGPFPPATGWTVGLEAVSQVLVSEGALNARLDSIQLGSPYQGIAHQYWFTASAAGVTATVTVPILQPEEIGVTSDTVGFRAVPLDASLAARYGGNASYQLPGQVSVALPGPDYLALYGRGCVNSRAGFDDPATCPYNGSRWFAGPSPETNETLANPIGCNTANFSNAVFPCYNNAGELPGVTTIYQTQCYQAAGGASCRPLAGIQSGAKRGADFNVYWSAGGVVDSVIDVTHNVVVPFDSVAGGTWGILNPGAATGTSPDASATLTNMDFACVEPFRTYAAGGFICAEAAPYRLSNTAVPGAVGFFSGGAYPPAVAITAAASAGFGMYIAGDMFTFELAGGALPADGAVWALRQYVGAIKGGNGLGAGDLGPATFSNPEEVLPFTAVGAELRANFAVTNTVDGADRNDLSQVHTVPDPYYVTSAFE
ncbi:MAG: hypothetical protein L0Y54_21200, partial [Sporichthyaceae bacterium]|nr:hypothetical protein [Sporichthyaceae bacterium]